MTEKKESGLKVVATNSKARHDYFILESHEAGIVLSGTEVKSVRQGRINLRDSYCQMHGSELFIMSAHISPYEQGNRYNLDPLRDRKLLLHRREINKLAGKTAERGLTIVPLRVYLKNNRVKIEIGIAKGKRTYDKRETIKRRDEEREIRGRLKNRLGD